MTHDQPIVGRRIYFYILPPGNSCNDAEEVTFPAAPEAVAVISADQKGSIWSAGCTVSLMDGTTSLKITQIYGKVKYGENLPESAGWVSFFQQSLPDALEVVDGQYISATVVYSFN